MTIEERIANEFNSNFDNLDNPIKKSIVDDIKSLVIKCCKEQREIDIQRACDAYCKVCGHFSHTTPTHICRHDCHYYEDFVKAMKGE